MWFNWVAMADACLRAGAKKHAGLWRGHLRAILLGLLNDGVLRGRFPVDGFSASDPDVAIAMRDYVVRLPDAQLQGEAARRFRRTSFGLPFG
jgi:hypothetical protein